MHKRFPPKLIQKHCTVDRVKARSSAPASINQPRSVFKRAASRMSLNSAEKNTESRVSKLEFLVRQKENRKRGP